MKTIVGENGDEEEVESLVALANVLASGQAPLHLAPYYGGGSLLATGKAGKDLEEDGRPIVSGEVWRRVIMKALLAPERRGLREYLEPHQLAMGTPGGVEAYAHVTRQWFESNALSATKVLINKDKQNAFNIVDRHKMLTACQEHLPGAAAFAEWCYGSPSFLFYGDVIIQSEKGCQQGCPLAMALYCLVDHQLRERSEIVSAAPQAPGQQLQPASSVELSASFADDSVDGGEAAEVQR